MKVNEFILMCIGAFIICGCAPINLTISKDLPVADKRYELMALIPAIEVHGLDILDKRNNESFYFIGGWNYKFSRGSSCTNAYLTLQSESTDKSDDFHIVRGRDEFIVMRWLGCSLSGNSASVFYGMMLNSRYFVFMTNEGNDSYIFFDRKEGKFLNYVLKDQTYEYSSKFYTAPDGTVIIEQVYTGMNSKPKVDAHRYYYVAKASGFDLTAPVESADLIEAKKYQTPQEDLWVTF